MSDIVLECKDLCKCYVPGKPVLKDFNCKLAAGKIIGLLGPNGCGKSTLIKLISGILMPDSGSIKVCGIERSEKTKALVSYLPERTYLNSAMTVNEVIELFLDFYADFDFTVARRMLDELGIDPAARLRTLSKGTLEKVQLIMVMARRAKLYLLDEPIAGVDPAARDYILKSIISAYNPESTVVITTHLIYDIENVLDEFCFLDRGGRVRLAGDADKVRDTYGKSLNELFREVFRC